MSSQAHPWFVAVGGSGKEGLEDIRALLSDLPVPLEAVLLVVLHRPWGRVSSLRSVLAHACHHPIVIANQEQEFEAGTVYIGSPSQHLTLVARNLGGIVDDPHGQYRNRTVDLLFRSVADHGKGKMIGVVLSGLLDDGARGLALIHEAGGLTMVLTPDPLHSGMPENAINFDGPIDLIGSPAQIAAGIARAVQGDVTARA